MWTNDIQNVSVHDVAIVPGVMFRNGKPHPYQVQRLEMALELYRRGRVGAILVSGDEERAGKEVSGMKRWLVERGVPSERVAADFLGTRTLETMNRAAALFGVRDAIVCTQSAHAPRTAFLARAAGIGGVVLVPRTLLAPDRNNEPLKVALAFVERYVLRRTGAGPGPTPGTLPTAAPAFARR